MSVTGGEPDSWCRARGTNTTGQVSHTTHLGSDSHSDTDKKLVSTIRNCDPAALRPGSQQAFPNTESKLGSHTRVTGEFKQPGNVCLGRVQSEIELGGGSHELVEVPLLQHLCEGQRASGTDKQITGPYRDSSQEKRSVLKYALAQLLIRDTSKTTQSSTIFGSIHCWDT